jgi:DNA-directed RNA polymerase sigma subunit (sigma70/sigma32)
VRRGAERVGCANTIPLQIEQFAQAAEFIHPRVRPDGTTLESMIADAAAPAPDPLLEAVEHEQARLVRLAVAQLEKRKREVVRNHFGLGQAEEPLGEVATELHLSPQRTRALEHDALYELRASLELAGIEP